MGMQEIRTALKVDLKKAPEHQTGLHVRSSITLPMLIFVPDTLYRTGGIQMVSEISTDSLERNQLTS